MFDENLLPFIARLNPTIMWIALTVGLLMFVIGYFAGGKLAMGRIGMCVLLTTILGVLSLPAPMRLFSLVERGLNVKTTVIGSDGKEVTANAKSKTAAKAKKTPSAADSVAAAEEDDIGSGVPFSLQLLTLILYLIWTAFLVGMGIFLYETLTVTAEEAEKR